MAISADRLAAVLAAANFYRDQFNRLRQAAGMLREGSALEHPAVALFLGEFLRPEDLAANDLHVETIVAESIKALAAMQDRRKGKTGPQRGFPAAMGKGMRQQMDEAYSGISERLALEPPSNPPDEEADPWTK